MDKFLKHFGHNLKTLRKSYNLSQEKFAEKLNLSTNTISTIETGRSFIKYPTLKSICQKLNVTPEILFCMENEKSPLLNEILLSVKTLTTEQQKQLLEIIKTFKK